MVIQTLGSSGLSPLPSSESGSLLLCKVSPNLPDFALNEELPQALVFQLSGVSEVSGFGFWHFYFNFLGGVGVGKGVTGEATAFPTNVKCTVLK